MSKKKRKEKNIRQSTPSVRLSLYMIVKNEEKDIEKALSWAKDITFEQIVVDTGSTDRTVEIAEDMGAKVYNFKWINDFAAARNFALEKTTGNWIAGIDADEYYTVEDAKKLLDFIKRIQSNRELSERCLAVSHTAINLNDEGKPTSSLIRICAFRNDPSIRFSGRIHERLWIDDDRILYADGVTLYHTGYSETEKKEKGKTERNVRMLRKELEREPENLTLKAYLADSLSAYTDEKSREETEILFTDVLSGVTPVHQVLKIKAYVFFIHKYLNDPENLQQCEVMCRRALDEFPGTLDFEYFLGYAFNNMGRFIEAWDQLRKCEMKLSGFSKDQDASYLIPDNPVMLYGQLMIAAHGLGDVENVVMYSTQILTIDKTRQEVLSSCIATLLRCGAADNDLIELLSQLYDFSDPDELMFIAKAAEDCGATGFSGRFLRSRNEL